MGFLFSVTHLFKVRNGLLTALDMDLGETFLKEPCGEVGLVRHSQGAEEGAPLVCEAQLNGDVSLEQSVFCQLQSVVSILVKDGLVLVAGHRFHAKQIERDGTTLLVKTHFKFHT